MIGHPSSLELDAMASGHLGDADAAPVRAHVEGCVRCRADVAAAEAACTEFARVVLPRTIGKLRPRRSPWRILGPALLVPALAAAALVLWLRAPGERPDDDLRIKGGLSFQVFADRGGEVIAVHDRTRLAPGDRIRFVVGSGGPGHLLVVSIDGAANATVYYPYGRARSGPVTATPGELPGSIVLDAAPGPERVFALVSDQPLDVAQIKRALAAIGAQGADAIRGAQVLDVPAAAQASVVFEKVTP